MVTQVNRESLRARAQLGTTLCPERKSGSRRNQSCTAPVYVLSVNMGGEEKERDGERRSSKGAGDDDDDSRSSRDPARVHRFQAQSDQVTTLRAASTHPVLPAAGMRVFFTGQKTRSQNLINARH